MNGSLQSCRRYVLHKIQQQQQLTTYLFTNFLSTFLMRQGGTKVQGRRTSAVPAYLMNYRVQKKKS